MTREEAIKIIDCYDIGFYDLSGEKIPADKLADAFDMAIEALLILGEDGIVNCCGCIHWSKEGFCKMTDRQRGDFDYCSDGRRE